MFTSQVTNSYTVPCPPENHSLRYHIMDCCDRDVLVVLLIRCQTYCSYAAVIGWLPFVMSTLGDETGFASCTNIFNRALAAHVLAHPQVVLAAYCVNLARTPTHSAMHAAAILPQRTPVSTSRVITRT